MNTPEDYILDALEIVTAWGIPDNEIAEAANQQAYVMAGCPPDHYYESGQAQSSHR